MTPSLHNNMSTRQQGIMTKRNQVNTSPWQHIAMTTRKHDNCHVGNCGHDNTSPWKCVINDTKSPQQYVYTTTRHHDKRNQVNTSLWQHVAMTTRKHDNCHVSNCGHDNTSPTTTSLQDNICLYNYNTALWHNVTYKLTRRFENTSVWQIIIMIKIVTMSTRYHEDTSQWHYH